MIERVAGAALTVAFAAGAVVGAAAAVARAAAGDAAAAVVGGTAGADAAAVVAAGFAVAGAGAAVGEGAAWLQAARAETTVKPRTPVRKPRRDGPTDPVRVTESSLNLRFRCNPFCFSLPKQFDSNHHSAYHQALTVRELSRHDADVFSTLHRQTVVDRFEKVDGGPIAQDRSRLHRADLDRLTEGNRRGSPGHAKAFR